MATPSTSDQLLAAFLSPSLSLASIAAEAGLSLSQLAAWFAEPETQATLEQLRAMGRFRAQLLADLGLPAAVETLNRVNADLAALQPEADAPITLHLRLADTARRTATAIQRLATPRTQPRGIGSRGIGVPADVRSDRLNADQIDPTPSARPSQPIRARDHPAAA